MLAVSMYVEGFFVFLSTVTGYNNNTPSKQASIAILN